MKSTGLALGGISLLPVTSKLISFENSDSIRLLENQHIRHGYYGNECLRNELTSSKLNSISIDRFLNPEGDMTLADMTSPSGNLRIFFSDKEVLIQEEGNIRQVNDLKAGEIKWILENRIALGKTVSGFKGINEFSECIFLRNTGEFCIYSKRIDQIQDSEKNELIVLIV